MLKKIDDARINDLLFKSGMTLTLVAAILLLLTRLFWFDRDWVLYRLAQFNYETNYIMHFAFLGVLICIIMLPWLDEKHPTTQKPEHLTTHPPPNHQHNPLWSFLRAFVSLRFKFAFLFSTDRSAQNRQTWIVIGVLIVAVVFFSGKVEHEISHFTTFMRPVSTVQAGGQNYHLIFYHDNDSFSCYELYVCDPFDVVCQKLQTVSHSRSILAPEPDAVRLIAEGGAISVTVDGEVVYTR